MPAPRTGLDEVVPRSYAYLEPAHPRDPGRAWSARSIPCPSCGAAVGAYCPGSRFCHARMTRLRDLANAGELEAVPIASTPTQATAPVFNASPRPVARDLSDKKSEPKPRSPHPHKGRDRKLNDAKHVEIVEKFRAGVKVATLAREYEVSGASIRYTLGKAGVR